MTRGQNRTKPRIAEPRCPKCMGAPEILGRNFLNPLSVQIVCRPVHARCGITKDVRIQVIRYDDLKQASKDDTPFSRNRTFLQKDWPHGTAVTPDVALNKNEWKDFRWRQGMPAEGQEARRPKSASTGSPKDIWAWPT